MKDVSSPDVFPERYIGISGNNNLEFLHISQRSHTMVWGLHRFVEASAKAEACDPTSTRILDSDVENDER